MANRIVLNETSYHGAGAIAEIANEAKARAFKKAFVCSDPDLIRFNVTKKVTDVLDEAGLSYEIYSNIKPNPTIENVQTGVAAFKASGADYLIAIGGGSSMDTAKAIGIIIAKKLRGCCSYQEPVCSDHCSSHYSRNRSRGYDQLCYYRCGEKAQIRMRRYT